MMKLYINLIVILFGLNLAHGQRDLRYLLEKYNNQEVPYVSVQELKMMQTNQKVLVADAREKKEYDVSHLPQAEFIGYKEFSIEKFSQKFKNKSAPIVVYCSIGIRSENIAEKIRKAGYSNVSNLYGGIFEWKNTGYDVFRNGKPTDSVHVFSKNWAKWLTNGKKVY
ncbi:MAG: rhodanese homology domain-containing protein [Christiangramia sp.]